MPLQSHCCLLSGVQAAGDSYEGSIPTCPDDAWTPGAAVLISHWAGPGKPDYWFICGWWLNSLKEKEYENVDQPFDTRLTLYEQRKGWGAQIWAARSQIDAWRGNLKNRLNVDLNAMISDVDLLAPAADLMTLVAVTWNLRPPDRVRQD